MTPDEAKKVLPIIQALAEGKPIQYLMWTGGWADAESVNLNFLKENPERFRVKPEPRRFTLMIPKPSNAFPDQGPRVPRRLENYNPEFWEKIEVVEVLNG